ncbi:hypothetical protein JCM8202_000605 [Rhodotorula sphaerocarpa]
MDYAAFSPGAYAAHAAAHPAAASLDESLPADLSHSFTPNATEPEDGLDGAAADESHADASVASEEDSLRGRSPSEVEHRALALLALPAHPAVVPPRPVPASAREPTDGQNENEPDVVARKKQAAIEYLSRMLDEAERDDWTYPTPRVFGPPDPVRIRDDHRSGRRQHGRALDLGEDVGAAAGEGGEGFDQLGAGSTPWPDRAFNLERYGLQEYEAEAPEPAGQQQSDWDGFDPAAYGRDDGHDSGTATAS